MNQKYTANKEVSLKFNSSRRLLKVLLVIAGICSCYLMVALLSFNPSDPSWFQTSWDGPIHNLAGGSGAWFADALFFIFGILAYAIPPLILFFFWNIFVHFRQYEYVDFLALSLKLIGSLALLLTSCELATLNINDLHYFPSGGIIGSLLSNIMPLWLNGIWGTISLLCVWASGFTLFIGCSWITIVKKTGSMVFSGLTFFFKKSHRANDDSNFFIHNDSENGYPLSPSDCDDSLLRSSIFVQTEPTTTTVSSKPRGDSQ